VLLGDPAAAPGATAPAGSIQVSASAVMPVASPGWIEILLVVRNGARPWRGVIEVSGARAKVHVRVSLPEYGQRVVALPFWLDPGSRAPHVWAGGAPAGTVQFLATGQTASRVLVADGSSADLSPGGWRPDVAPVRVPAARLPQTWRAYDGLDLVILPAERQGDLRPAQVAALEQWVRWGGAVSLVRARGEEPTTTRSLGAGVTIVARSPVEALAARDRTRATGEHVARAVMSAWERSRPAIGGPQETTGGRPGTGLGVVVAVHLGLLVVAAAVAGRFPGVRQAGRPVLIAIIGGASLASWGVARAGSAWPLDVRETTLIRARPQGGVTHISAVARVQARRRGISRLVPRVEAPHHTQAEAPSGPGNPHRAITWDPDTDTWERQWAMGETSVLRLDGIGPDIGLQVHRGPTGAAWEIENHGPHALRRTILIRGDDGAQALADLPPGSRTRIEIATAVRNANPTTPDLEFWKPLLPERAAGSAVLLATLDPPIRALGVPDDDRATPESHLIVALPPLRDGRE
jgi:hypothetical protein